VAPRLGTLPMFIAELR